MKLSEVSQAKVSLAGAAALKTFFDTLQADETADEDFNHWILRWGGSVDAVNDPPEVVVQVAANKDSAYTITIQSIVNDLDALYMNSDGEFVNHNMHVELFEDSPVWVVLQFKLPAEAAIEAATADLSTSDGIMDVWKNISADGKRLTDPKVISTTLFRDTSEYKELMASLHDDEE